MGHVRHDVIDELAGPAPSTWSRVRALERAERARPESTIFEGPRTDLSSGRGVRVRIGLLSDGTYGVERFAADGTRTVATFA